MTPDESLLARAQRWYAIADYGIPDIRCCLIHDLGLRLREVLAERDAANEELARVTEERDTWSRAADKASAQRDAARATLARVREVAEEHTDNPCAAAVLDAMEETK